MKVIFLDFDGVLNSLNTTERIWHGSQVMVGLDPEKVKLVSSLAERTDSSIVISSTWRHFYSLSDLIHILRKSGLNPGVKVIGTTPSKMSSSRGYEIEMWLNDHKDDVESFVVLDDLKTPFTRIGRQVLTDLHTGLTAELAAEASQILETPLERH